MSKAFTKEDSAGELPVIRAAPTVAPGEKRYITAEGMAALIRQKEALAARILETPVTEVALRNELEVQRAVLEATIAVLTVADPPVDPARVFFGAWVVLEDEDGGTVTYRLVGPDETDVREGRISVDSPVARALLGRAVGDSVTVQRPKGALEYTVQEIRYDGPPER